MVGEEAFGLLFAHVADEYFGVCFGQVDDKQRIENITEVGVEVAFKQSSAQPEILPQQNRHAFLVELNI